jgi:light-regulated signal transduction histidine kinase (bacteriophytochrome)
VEEFSYTVSHDLRGPLRAISAYAQALIEDCSAQLDPPARTYVERILRSSERMETLTRDVLTYSRLARSELPLTSVDPGRLPKAYTMESTTSQTILLVEDSARSYLVKPPTAASLLSVVEEVQTSVALGRERLLISDETTPQESPQ